MAPEDLAEPGIPGGGPIAIRSEAGAIVIDAAPLQDVRRGTVVVPHGLPDVNVNAVIPSGVAAVERISGQHWMTGVPVEVRAAAEV
jgi:formylmethanofuran dehydrogenase subunit D